MVEVVHPTQLTAKTRVRIIPITIQRLLVATAGARVGVTVAVAVPAVAVGTEAQAAEPMHSVESTLVTRGPEAET